MSLDDLFSEPANNFVATCHFVKTLLITAKILNEASSVLAWRNTPGGAPKHESHIDWMSDILDFVFAILAKKAFGNVNEACSFVEEAWSYIKVKLSMQTLPQEQFGWVWQHFSLMSILIQKVLLTYIWKNKYDCQMWNNLQCYEIWE